MKTIEVKKPSAYTTQIGPAHPALKEPVMFTLDIEGEQIKKVDFVPGMAHRGIEWMGMRRNCIQVLYLAERICGICGITHSISFARAVEQIAQIQVPNRAHYIRAIVGELERIHSHLLWAGVAAHELGFDSAFYMAWRCRENVLDLLEYLTGNRIHYAMIQIGGVRRDIVPDQFPHIEESMKFFEEAYDKLAAVFLDDTTVQMRCRDCGVLTYDEARQLCPVGPTARASGIKKDVRIDHPYAAYADLEIDYMTPDVLTGEVRGDVYDRIITRLLEVKQSVDLVRQLISMLPDGPLLAIPKPAVLLAKLKGAAGEAVGRHEAPRGEVMHYVRLEAGKDEPVAWKVKASSYSNYLSWIPMMEGAQIADIPIIAASIDPCISCTDRVALVRQDTREVLTKEELHRLSVEKTRRIQASLAK
ncbi:MAG: nickel-dependent hydrogenase large subunit [Kiritimatiellae bacterium]|jgi:membrane-bound hydrogenase subunit alpha|nr:nickel-dependent hydrogenase large subunit [Kiritimatiellia bacterium]NLD90474.1 NADH dehydrogenase subunit [Lentisphaerota bacterium]